MFGYDETILEQGLFFEKTGDYLGVTSEGNELTKEQQEYFKDSKVRDKEGKLKVMYHGSPNEFTVFDKKKARTSGLNGRGFYFTDSQAHAGTYGNMKKYYLDIKNPVMPGENKLTKEGVYNLLKYIEEDGEDYDLYNYGEGATAKSVLDTAWSNSKRM